MIGTCIALAIWTSGLLYMTTRAEKRKVEARSDGVEADKNFEASAGEDVKV
jgi:MFS transporter, ACS family, pantothenate transporter